MHPLEIVLLQLVSTSNTRNNMENVFAESCNIKGQRPQMSSSVSDTESIRALSVNLIG